MTREGESPGAGCVLLFAAGFIACVGIALSMAAGVLSSLPLWIEAGCCMPVAAGMAWAGWTEVAEATRFRQVQDAHRIMMLRAAWLP
jgi:hypothetical protein